MPNIVALTSEYAPKRLMSVAVSMLFCGMPLGALLGGLVSSVMLPRFGWQSVFYVGGIVPLVVALILIKALPESVRFLTVSGADPKKIRSIMARISPDLAEMPINALSASQEKRKAFPVRYLFTDGRALGTLLLWIPYFMNLLIIYFIVSWLPSLLQQSDMPVTAGIMAISLFSLAGIVGSLVQGRMMNTYGNYLVLGAEFGISTLLIGSLAYSTSLPLTMAITFLLGFAVEGAQAGLNAVVAGFYPTSIRSTGVGWALGVGRIGSIVGPLIAGFMLSAGEHPRQIFLSGAVPALLAGLAIALNGRIVFNSRVARADLDPKVAS
jgi:AAHS family 4-hydroxybenzoate transporter-like MFS transporter